MNNAPRQSVLVSACLLGLPVRYNGVSVASDAEILQRWVEEGRVIAVCPEVDAGLPARRPPAEICNCSNSNSSNSLGGLGVLAGTARVLEKTGGDVSREFLAGAKQLAEVARQGGIRLAILKEGSPSCGTGFIYDGSFSGIRVPFSGVASALLQREGVRVFNETQLAEALCFLEQLEAKA